MSVSTQNLKNVSFGTYTDKILNLANQTFTGLYHKVYKQYWHDNKFFAKMNQCYCTTDNENAVYETYIPTRNQTHGLNFYRIAIKLLPEVDNQTFREETEKLRTPLRMPPGQLDSELQIIISPKLKKWGFIRAYKHNPNKGYLSTIYITKERNPKTGKSDTIPPEVLWVRIVRAIATFLDKRITAYLTSLHLVKHDYDHIDNNRHYYIESISAVLTRFSLEIRNALLCMSQVLDVLLHKIWSVQAEIGVQNKAFSCSVSQMREEILYLQQAIKAKFKLENNLEVDKGLNFLNALVVNRRG